MSLILAIEPDRRQASQIAVLVRNILHAELVLADSADRGLRGLGQRLPDLILTSALLSPGDEALLADRLREFDDASAHVQTLTIPVLAASSGEATANAGMLGRLRRRMQLRSAPDGCDPAVFAQQITEYLERSATDRQRQSRVDAPPTADGLGSAVPVQSQVDGRTNPLTPRVPEEYPEATDNFESRALNDASEASPEREFPFVDSPRPAFGLRAGLEPPPLRDTREPGDDPAADDRQSTDDHQLATHDSQLSTTDVLRALGLSVVSDSPLTDEAVRAAEPVVEARYEEVDLTSALDELEERGTELREPEIVVAVDWEQSDSIDPDLWEFREAAGDDQETELWTPLPTNVHLVWPAPQGIVLKDAPPPEWADWAMPADIDSEMRQTIASTGSGFETARPSSPTVPTTSLLGDKNERGRPAIDEWGLFDPAQCGFEALLVKLDSLTEEGR
jgi:hypothetical protein